MGCNVASATASAVQLLWRTHDDERFVANTDSEEHPELCVEVRDRGRAIDVFHHPFAYAAHHGGQVASTRPRPLVSLAVAA